MMKKYAWKESVWGNNMMECESRIECEIVCSWKWDMQW